MARGDSLARQLHLMQLLQDRQEVAVHEVARELGWTPRTVYRDLAVLERIGVPIYQERKGRRARWRVVDGYRRRLSVSLSWAEMLALAAGRKLLAGVGGTLDAAAASAAAKIGGALPSELGRRALRADASIAAVLGAQHEHREEVVAMLAQAIERGETVRIAHRKASSRAAEDRVVDPYLLHVQGGALYLFAWTHDRGAVRMFRVDRIREAHPTGRVFADRVAFSLSELVHGAFGPWAGAPQRIRLEFDARVAPIVAEARMHPTQRSQWRDDGSLDVELRAAVSPALAAWVLGFGASVRVLAPAALARRVAREHARAARLPPAACVRRRAAAEEASAS